MSDPHRTRRKAVAVIKIIRRTLGFLCMVLLMAGIAVWLAGHKTPRNGNNENKNSEHSEQHAQGHLREAGEHIGQARQRQQDPANVRHDPPAAEAVTARTDTSRYRVSLEGASLDTRTDSPAGWTTPMAPTAIHALKQELMEQTATREVYPVIVQFNGIIQPAWKDELSANGITLIGYLPENSYLAEATLGQIDYLGHCDHIQWLGAYKPAYKLSPSLPRSADASEVIPVVIQTFAPNDVDSAAPVVTDRGGDIAAAKGCRRWGMIRADIPAGALQDIARLASVQWIEPYKERIMLNNVAVEGPRMNVTNVWTARGLTGAGQIIGHADSGLDIGTTNGIHPDFAGRLKVAYALGRTNTWSDPNGHGTHTAGSILGAGTASTNLFKGVAHEALLVHQSVMDAGGGLGGLPYDIYDLFLPTYTNGARIHSDSWGASRYGAYTLDSRSCDEFMWDHPDMLLVFSAGNDGADNNQNGIIDLNSMGSPATAKNTLSIGAAESLRPPGSGGYSGSTYGGLWPFDYGAEPIKSDHPSFPADGTNQGMAGFSSRGPTDDGRFKPDIVAPGTDIVSCKSREPGAGNGWGIHPNTNYCFMGGTSMACPLTAGAAALVRQFYAGYRNRPNPSAALVKATMLNGARSLTPGQYGTNLYREIPPLPRPNNVEGWGQVNLEETLFPSIGNMAGLDFTNGLVTAATNSLQVVVLDSAEVNFTMTYSDYPATAGSGKKLINDLDVLVVGPDGSNYFPNGFAGADHTNNTETIVIPTPAPGHYTVYIIGYNVPEGPQPYALVIHGNIHLAPEIHHVPLQNQFSTNVPYMVDATITGPTPVDTNQLFVYWNTTGSTSVFASAAMSWVSNDLYRGYIPAQPMGTEVYYFLSSSTNLELSVDPPDAPSSLHHFRVTQPFTLNVAGSPHTHGHPDPAYGTHTFGSGYVVHAQTELAIAPTNGERYACSGWSGTGDVPSSGTSNSVTFTVSTNSSLIWQWALQYELVQASTPPGILSTSTWWFAGSVGQTVPADMTGTYTGATYQLASWYVDGARRPDATGKTENPCGSIPMTTARSANALYLPADQDSDGNGLMDWWEMYYFGAIGQDAHGDTDGDGYDENLEFLDRTDPRDPLSHPVHPGIAHTPLTDPQVTLAPYSIVAVITDNYTVVQGTLWWQKNYGAWTNAVLQALPDNTYSNSIPAPGTNSDHIAYYIEAHDHAGLGTTTAVYSFDIRYPRAIIEPERLTNFHLLPKASATAYLQISNAGLNELHWQLDSATVGLQDDMEHGTNGWRHEGLNDSWGLQTYRAHSTSQAWYNGIDSAHLYDNSVDARLITPAIGLGATPQLSFWHWAIFEYDSGSYFWDGGIVEISTNGGESFEQITPVGGYDGLIVDNPASPFAPDTPCFGYTSGTWQQVVFDLTDYAWQQALIAFRFGSDAFVVEEGWYVDDVMITGISTTNAWISFPETNGTVSVGTSSNVAVTVSSAFFDPPQTWEAFAAIHSDDPLAGTAYVALAMRLLPAVQLVVLGEPFQAGIPAPYPYGTNYIPIGEVVTNLVASPFSPTTGTRYVSTGWTGAGAIAPTGTGTEVIYTATTNASLTWYWEKQHLFTLIASNGAILGATSGWQHADWLFDLLPRAAPGWLFHAWQKGATEPFHAVPLHITSDAPWTVQAVFTPSSWDISATGTVTRTGWRIVENAFGTFDVANPADSGMLFLDRFIYAISPSPYMHLRYPDGTSPSGLEYIDITA
ncbi:MAG: hypothetical protein EOM20_15970, partial [Spartobacteria bacterium]|nr:hypothetical protein [Spartobacteria bacterium]